MRKWREAYGLTVQNYLSTYDKVKAAADKIAQIIDSKPDGYFYPKEYFGGPRLSEFRPRRRGPAQRAAIKSRLVPFLAGFACGNRRALVGPDAPTRNQLRQLEYAGAVRLQQRPSRTAAAI
ncbi:MAG: hypothetical protein WDN48_18900 [Pseudolabrys sp.]